jgi:hypothetical protein
LLWGAQPRTSTTASTVFLTCPQSQRGMFWWEWKVRRYLG